MARHVPNWTKWRVNGGGEGRGRLRSHQAQSRGVQLVPNSRYSRPSRGQLTHLSSRPSTFAWTQAASSMLMDRKGNGGVCWTKVSFQPYWSQARCTEMNKEARGDNREGLRWAVRKHTWWRFLSHHQALTSGEKQAGRSRADWQDNYCQHAPWGRGRHLRIESHCTRAYKKGFAWMNGWMNE